MKDGCECWVDTVWMASSDFDNNGLVFAVSSSGRDVEKHPESMNSFHERSRLHSLCSVDATTSSTHFESPVTPSHFTISQKRSHRVHLYQKGSDGTSSDEARQHVVPVVPVLGHPDHPHQHGQGEKHQAQGGLGEPGAFGPEHQGHVHLEHRRVLGNSIVTTGEMEQSTNMRVAVLQWILQVSVLVLFVFLNGHYYTFASVHSYQEFLLLHWQKKCLLLFCLNL